MPLPERRKTPEELARLRESLGIPGEGPASDAPDTPTPPTTPSDSESREDPVPGKPARAASDAEPKTAPAGDDSKRSPEEPGTVVHSLRKSASLPVDQPKPVRHREDGSLPVRRHTDEELMRLRRMDAAPNVSAAEVFEHQKLSRPEMILLYLLAGAGLSLLLIESLWLSNTAAIDLPFDWLRAAVRHDAHRAVAMGLVGGVNVLVLLAAGWVAWRRRLSRHHAGFLTIIAVLVLVFGTLYFFPNLHAA